MPKREILNGHHTVHVSTVRNRPHLKIEPLHLPFDWESPIRFFAGRARENHRRRPASQLRSEGLLHSNDISQPNRRTFGNFGVCRFARIFSILVFLLEINVAFRKACILQHLANLWNGPKPPVIFERAIRACCRL